MRNVKLDGSETRELYNESTGTTLSVIHGHGLTFSCWRTSPEEQQQLLAGEPVWVAIKGEAVPEFHVTVGTRYRVIPPSVIKQARKKSLIKEQPAYQEAVMKAKWLSRAEEALAWVYVGVAVLGVLYLGFKLKVLLLG